MSNEVELKLAVAPDALPILSEYLQQFKILAQQSQFLGNTYYDYPDHFLAQQKMGLRVRREDESHTLTLKTNGLVQGGLHQRPEYNLPLERDKVPENHDLMALYPFENLPPSPLKAIFSTDFQRTFWLIAFAQSEIEVAFDQGTIKNGSKEEAICEIEFELKRGEVADLFRLVAQLPLADNLYFSADSKAKRGYRLGSKALAADWLNIWRDKLADDREQPKTAKAALAEMLQMEQKLTQETLAMDVAALSQDFMQTVARVGAFFNLFHYYEEQGERWVQGLLQAQLQPLVTEEVTGAFLQSNCDFNSAIKDLIRFHSETKDNQATIEKLRELLKSRAYFERMLNLMLLNL